MYNLAGHYLSGKGVEQNKALSDQWMKNAIHSGLVEAYLTFNSHAVSPAEGVHISFKSGPLYWLAKQEPDQYTIQLASSRSKKLIEEKFRENELKGKGGYFQYEKSGKEYYALVFGSYETVSAAKLAIANLPESLRKSPPWVRKISSLHKISKLP
jgi:septal ring-binding cell division protein DamX